MLRAERPSNCHRMFGTKAAACLVFLALRSRERKDMSLAPSLTPTWTDPSHGSGVLRSVGVQGSDRVTGRKLGGGDL